MSYLAKKQRSFLMRCYLHCQNLVMISLIFSLMLLLTALGLSIYYEELPVPDKLVRKLQSEFEKQGLDLDFENIALDFRGKFSLKVLASPLPILRALPWTLGHCIWISTTLRLSSENHPSTCFDLVAPVSTALPLSQDLEQLKPLSATSILSLHENGALGILTT